MEVAVFGPSRCVGREGEEGEAQAWEGRERRRRRAAGGAGEDEDETRRRHGVFSAGRITMKNRKAAYIFAGPAPEEKSDSSERNREEAGGREEGAAEAASSESCCELSGPQDGRSNG